MVKAKKAVKKTANVTSSSTAEYFSKNLQQVGFSSPTKAVLTTLKEAFDNSLDACEDSGILPDIHIQVKKLGAGSLRNTDRILVRVEDNGPGIDIQDIPRVFGEYLASSKFGRGRCSRGQQGIGISAATTWSLQTAAQGAKVISKVRGQKKAVSCRVAIDLKNNRGVLQEKEAIDWEKAHGTIVEFVFDGRIQLNGEAGLYNYIKGNVLVNPHLSLSYELLDDPPQRIERVTDDGILIPEPTAPHPHTMKLGEFIAHAKLYGNAKFRVFLKNGFSRLSDKVIDTLPTEGKFLASLLNKSMNSVSPEEFTKVYKTLQNIDLRAPATDSVVSIGEEALAKSIRRLGEIDYFSVVTRKPAICDFKPVQVEVALARLSQTNQESEEPVQVLRFANRVPLQFDKAGCAIAKAITSVNWRSYGIKQPRESFPQGPYIFAVSVVSPFIKFRNASKETIDTSDELVEEIRRALMQGGQKLSRHLRRESKANELEERIQYIEKFAPILVEGLARITSAPDSRKVRATEGLKKILGRDAQATEKELKHASHKLDVLMQSDQVYIDASAEEVEGVDDPQLSFEEVSDLQISKSKNLKNSAYPKNRAKKAAAVPTKKKSTPIQKEKQKIPAKSANKAKVSKKKTSK